MLVPASVQVPESIFIRPPGPPVLLIAPVALPMVPVPPPRR